MLNWTAWWLEASAFCTLGGWGLSLAGQLGAGGYLVLLGAGFVLAMGIARRVDYCRLPALPRIDWRRYRRPWPAAFAVAALMVAGGALAYPPGNIDAMAYRVPRVLHWLALGRWHWIDTVDPRMNYSACGQEWLMAPWMALTGSDRLVWVWSLGGWLMLPGLLFIVLRDLGVRARVASTWMWLLPLAPVYVLQAGGAANDLLGTAYFIAALAFAARLRRDGSSAALFFSILAMALTTGVKASNLPLVLPWLAVVGPVVWPHARLRRLAGATALGALLVSVVPTLIANQTFSGAWTGDPGNETALRVGRIGSGLLGNLTQLVAQNLAPPVFPGALSAETWCRSAIEPAMRRWLRGDFPRFTFHFGELAQEEWAGLGGLMVLLLAGGCLGRRRHREIRAASSRRSRVAVWLAAGAAAGAYGAVMGSEMPARLLAPYYPLGVAGVLVASGSLDWVRTRTFRVLAVLTVVGSLLPVALSPARPLLPAPLILRLSAPMSRWAPSVIARARVLYAVYAERSDPLAQLRTKLPIEVRILGFMATADDSEISGWRPFGRRRVVTVRETESAAALRARGISWVMVRGDAVWPAAAARTAWLAGHAAHVAEEISVQTKARQPAEDWFLVRLE